MNDKQINHEQRDDDQDLGFETIDLDQLIGELGEESKAVSGAHIKLVNVSKNMKVMKNTP